MTRGVSLRQVKLYILLRLVARSIHTVISTLGLSCSSWIIHVQKTQQDSGRYDCDEQPSGSSAVESINCGRRVVVFYYLAVVVCLQLPPGSVVPSQKSTGRVPAACTNCRSRKQKCEFVPGDSTCRRCTANGLECLKSQESHTSICHARSNSTSLALAPSNIDVVTKKRAIQPSQVSRLYYSIDKFLM